MGKDLSSLICRQASGKCPGKSKACSSWVQKVRVWRRAKKQSVGSNIRISERVPTAEGCLVHQLLISGSRSPRNPQTYRRSGCRGAAPRGGGCGGEPGALGGTGLERLTGGLAARKERAAQKMIPREARLRATRVCAQRR